MNKRSAAFMAIAAILITSTSVLAFSDMSLSKTDMTQRIRGAVTSITPLSVKSETLRTHKYNYTGMVQSVSGTTIITKGKTLGVKTVITDNSTEFFKSKIKISLSDITAGSKIKISGTWDRTDKIITAKKVTLVPVAKKK